MQATIKHFTNGEWKTAFSIATEPLTVTDADGQALTAEELQVWAENQTPAIYEGKRHTPLTDVESWLRGLQARRYTYMSVELSE